MIRAEEQSDGPQLATTLPRFMHAAAAAYGDDTAVTLRQEGCPDESISFVQLDRRSADLAKGLIARGAGKGSRIGFILGNGPDFAITLAAIARIGAIAVPISTLIKSNELVRVLRQSDVAGLIVQRSMLGKDLVERLCNALPELSDIDDPDLRLPQTPYLRWVVSTGDSLPNAVHDLAWLTGASTGVDDVLLQAIEDEVYPTDQMVEIYTSGSMALPKGVKHTHGAVLFRTHYIRSMTPLARGEEKPVPLPMFWVGGLMMSLLPNLEAGATSVCTEATMMDSRLAMGSVLADDDMFAIPEGVTVWALGMTETLGPYSYGDVLRAPGYPLCAPLDHIADGFELRVVDSDGNPVAEGEPGEIQVRGYALTPGLHKMERSGFFTADGFYHTGDMGVIEGTRIHFVGRNGDMIKTASTNVSPAEVELEMQQLPEVHSAYVVGIPDAERGQLVVAAVVPRDGIEPDFEQIQATLRERLSSYKVPRAYVAISRDEVPMLHSNKVARRAIERMMIERLNRES